MLVEIELIDDGCIASPPVKVPLPNSSNKHKDCEVACLHNVFTVNA